MILAAALVVGASGASGQVHWQPAWPATGVYNSLSGYDPDRGVLLVLDGRGDTWEWDGHAWARVAAAAAVAGSYGRWMIYDEARRVFVVPGGGHAMYGDQHPAAEWWEFDGRAWTSRTASLDPPWQAPGPRTGYAAAYDPGVGGLEMFGGYYNFMGSPSGYAIFADDWNYAAGAWSLREWGPLGPRVGSSMAFDYARGVMVLVGGAPDIYSFTYHDQWEHGPGEPWRRVADAIPYLPYGLAWDATRGAVIGFSSGSAGGSARRVLANGAWGEEPVSSLPTTSDYWGVGFDGGRGVRVVYNEVERYTSSIDLPRPGVRELRGADWVRVGVLPPIARTAAEMVYDEARGEFVLFGGYSGGSSSGGASPIPDPATWTLGDQGWERRSSPGPVQLMNTAMCFDSRRGVTVLACGRVPPNDATYLGETWEWDGSAWTQRATTGPAARARHAMAFDRRRGVSVLFGGRNAQAPLRYFPETWEWDGAAWTRRDIPGPGGRQWAKMVYDEARGVVVLFGGAGPNGAVLGDTWEFDGAAWVQRQAPGPAPRALHAMVYDPDRGVTLMWGGGDGSHALLDAWEWDGARWTARPDLTLARGSSGAAAAYNRAEHRIVSFGGTGENTFIIGSLQPEMAILGPDCPDPVVTRQPVATSTPNRGAIVLSVETAGDGNGLTYQWRHGWPPAPIEGAVDPVLRVPDATLAQAGRYDCIVVAEGPCFRRRVASQPATVSVCVADFNGDGFIEATDYADYVQAYESGDPAADVNGDGFLDFFDHDAFVEQWETGCGA